MRAYNSKIDKYYSPDDTPELYLTDEQIELGLSLVPIYKEDSEIEVRELIRKIEIINQQEKLLKVSKEESFKVNKELANNFFRKYGFWPYLTKTYKNFYSYFIK